MAASFGPQSPSWSYAGAQQESLQQHKFRCGWKGLVTSSKRCSYHSYHSGNSKDFRSTMPGKETKTKYLFPTTSQICTLEQGSGSDGLWAKSCPLLFWYGLHAKSVYIFKYLFKKKKEKKQKNTISWHVTFISIVNNAKRQPDIMRLVMEKHTTTYKT